MAGYIVLFYFKHPVQQLYLICLPSFSVSNLVNNKTIAFRFSIENKSHLVNPPHLIIYSGL